VDDLGGIDSAVQKARELAGIPASSRVSLVLYPAKKSLLDYIMQATGTTKEWMPMLARAGLEPLRAALHDSRLRVWMHGGMMRMMPFSLWSSNEKRSCCAECLPHDCPPCKRSFMIGVWQLAHSVMPPPADISGSWTVTGDVVGNAINMKCAFTQDGAKVSGHLRGMPRDSTKATGSVAADKVTFPHTVNRGRNTN
jgi:hypothetical protein